MKAHIVITDDSDIFFDAVKQLQADYKAGIIDDCDWNSLPIGGYRHWQFHTKDAALTATARFMNMGFEFVQRVI